MGQNWKDLCVQVQQGSAINKSSGETLDVINNWHQLMRFNSLIMSQKLSQPVSWLLSKKQAADVEYHINSDLDNLVKNTHQLIAHFDIPNTAAPIQIHADFLRRQLIFSVSLDAPADRKKTFRMRKLVNQTAQDASRNRCKHSCNLALRQNSAHNFSTRTSF